MTSLVWRLFFRFFFTIKKITCSLLSLLYLYFLSISSRNRKSVYRFSLILFVSSSSFLFFFFELNNTSFHFKQVPLLHLMPFPQWNICTLVSWLLYTRKRNGTEIMEQEWEGELPRVKVNDSLKSRNISLKPSNESSFSFLFFLFLMVKNCFLVVLVNQVFLKNKRIVGFNFCKSDFPFTKIKFLKVTLQGRLKQN